MSYQEFLTAKRQRVNEIGPEVQRDGIHPMLHDWQAEIVQWAARTGRAAIWADTGLGKTFMQVEWLRHVTAGGYGLIVAPLAVCHQTVREAAKIGVTATYVRTTAQITGPGIYVTNYEMVEHFDPDDFRGVVLDEASILKQSDGKTRTMLIRHFQSVPFRLTCTATPAPNDPEELTNQAEFLGHMSRVHMLAAYFIHDDVGWRLKGHAREPMMRWMATWALAIRKPSDLGYSDAGYDLPGLKVISHLIEVPIEAEGQLFPTDLGGVGGRAAVRRETLAARCDVAIQLVNESHGRDSLSDKLATWHGSPSTQQIAAPSTQPTRPSANGERLKGDRPKSTRSTCGATTERTKSGSSSTNVTPPSAETPNAGSGTRATRRIAQNVSASPNCETPNPSETLASAAPTGSPQASTTNSLSCKVKGAPSVAPTLLAMEGVDSLLTTVTRPVESGASSAERATSDLESSEMIQSFSDERRNTYSELEPWLLWVDLNSEQEYIAAALGDRCFSVTGSQSPEEKADLILRWVAGERPILLTKPKIAAFGLNFQHCARMAFVGLSDSYEQYYQSIRRCYRYGQTRVVHAHVALSELESQIATNIARKEREASSVTAQLVRAMRRNRENTDV